MPSQEAARPDDADLYYTTLFIIRMHARADIPSRLVVAFECATKSASESSLRLQYATIIAVEDRSICICMQSLH